MPGRLPIDWYCKKLKEGSIGDGRAAGGGAATGRVYVDCFVKAL